MALAALALLDDSLGDEGGDFDRALRQEAGGACLLELRFDELQRQAVLGSDRLRGDSHDASMPDETS
jgi:hypothetical protein